MDDDKKPMGLADQIRAARAADRRQDANIGIARFRAGGDVSQALLDRVWRHERIGDARQFALEAAVPSNTTDPSDYAHQFQNRPNEALLERTADKPDLAPSEYIDEHRRMTTDRPHEALLLRPGMPMNPEPSQPSLAEQIRAARYAEREAGREETPAEQHLNLNGLNPGHQTQRALTAEFMDNLAARRAAYHEELGELSLAEQMRAARDAQKEQAEAWTLDVKRATGLPAQAPETPALPVSPGPTQEQVERMAFEQQHRTQRL